MVPNAEAVKWFETVDNSLREKFLAPAQIPAKLYNNTELVEIDKPTGKAYEALKKYWRDIRVDKQKENDKGDRKKAAYIIAVFVVSSFTAILTAASLLGNTWINIPVAISIGFTLYRVKDVLKLLPQEKEAAATKSS